MFATSDFGNLQFPQIGLELVEGVKTPINLEQYNFLQDYSGITYATE